MLNIRTFKQTVLGYWHINCYVIVSLIVFSLYPYFFNPLPTHSMKKWLYIGIGLVLFFGVIWPRLNMNQPGWTPPTTTEPTPDPAAMPRRPDVDILQSSETLEPYTKSRIVHVEIKNNTEKLITYLDLKSVYKSKSGQIVGTGIGNATNIAGWTTKTVDVLATGIQGADKYEIEVGNVLYSKGQ